MNRIINVTGINQIKKISIVKATTTAYSMLPFQLSYRFESTVNNNEEVVKQEKKSIISNEFIPRRRISSEYRPPISRRPKPIRIQDPDIDFKSDQGITILGNKKDGIDTIKANENNKHIYEKMWLPDETYTNVMKLKYEDVYKDDELSQIYNPYVSDTIKYINRLKERGQHINATPSEEFDKQLRLFDWITAEQGSTEDAIMTRRAFAEGTWNEEERKELKKTLDDMVEKLREEQFELKKEDGEYSDDEDDKDDTIGDSEKNETEDDEENPEDERDLVKDTPWRDMIVDISRVQKVTRSGTIVSYRALVVGGNTRGVAGYGIGKGAEPDVATASAKRMCHRNIFFMTPYQGSGLTHDLVGKHNNCKVVIRAVSQGYGLQGNNLIQDILLAFGVTNATAKAYGRRNIYSVVYATFKAIAGHQDLESVSLVRGKKFLNMDRARRLSFK